MLTAVIGCSPGNLTIRFQMTIYQSESASNTWHFAGVGNV